MRDRRTHAVKQLEMIHEQLKQAIDKPNQLPETQSRLLIQHISVLEQHLSQIEDALLTDPLNSPLTHTWTQATYALQKLYERLEQLNKIGIKIPPIIIRTIEPSPNQEPYPNPNQTQSEDDSQSTQNRDDSDSLYSTQTYGTF